MSNAETRPYSDIALIAGAATVALDITSRLVSATCWESSRSLSEESADLLDRQSIQPTITTSASAIFDGAVHELSARPVTPELLDLARRIDRDSRLLFQRADFGTAAVPQLTTDAPLRVVIPYRATSESPGRRENLAAVLRALRRQNLRRDEVAIVVVEQSTRSAVPAGVRHLIDDVVTIADDGPFNKARAMNAGVRDASADTLLCLLDGDILPDGGFLARNFGRLHYQPLALHLPYTNMHCLLPADSARLRSGERPGSTPLDGWTITHPPGGCVFLTARLFRETGGFDERFVGWGGEDRDFVDRVQSSAEIRRHPELLLHLDHERPPMRSDREEIMSVLEKGGR